MKVLIISHNPITDYNNMGKTLLSLFNIFSKEELCHFYIYPTIPNIKKCQSCYRVTDSDMVKNIFPFSKRGREIMDSEIVQENTLYDNSNSGKLYKNKSSLKELKLIARNIIWKLGRWETPQFKKWMEKEKPDVIFACAGLSSFFYDVILKISKRYNIPIVSYVCDDFYFSFKEVKGNIIKRAYYASLCRKIDKLMRASRHIVTICDELGEAYKKEFSSVASTVFTGANTKISESIVSNNSKTIRYFGGIQLNRHESLVDIGKALDKINLKNNEDYRLEIYTGETDEIILSVFKDLQSVNVKSFVGSEEVHRLMNDSLMLIHTESFKKNDIERVRFSVSTKIADSMASGIPLLAYGPACIASMGHLIRNNAAVTITDPQELCEKLSASLKDAEMRESAAKNGIETAKRCHNAEIQSEKLKSVLKEVL